MCRNVAAIHKRYLDESADVHVVQFLDQRVAHNSNGCLLQDGVKIVVFRIARPRDVPVRPVIGSSRDALAGQIRKILLRVAAENRPHHGQSSRVDTDLRPPPADQSLCLLPNIVRKGLVDRADKTAILANKPNFMTGSKSAAGVGSELQNPNDTLIAIDSKTDGISGKSIFTASKRRGGENNCHFQTSPKNQDVVASQIETKSRRIHGLCIGDFSTIKRE